MNGKKAKALRRVVNHVFLEKDENFPYREYEKQKFRKIDIGKTDPVTKKHEPKYFGITTTLVLIDDCLRKRYKEMKQNYFEVNKYGRILNQV